MRGAVVDKLSDPRLRCAPAHFKNMRLVLDITFCGDRASPSFAAHCGHVNQSCEDFVRNDFQVFDEA